MQDKEEDQMSLFACPSCGTDVGEDDKECPGCNAQFEENGKTHNMTPNEDQIIKDPKKDDQIIYPPPPDWVEQKQKEPQSTEDPKGLSATTSEASEVNEDNPPEVKGNNGDLKEEEVEDKNEKEDLEETVGKKEGLEMKADSDESILDNEEEQAISESNVPEDGETSKSEEMKELKRLDHKIDLHNELLIEENRPENKVMAALKEYNANRRKRYFTGTMFIGLGVILFVLLWLVVVYDVLVHETQAWFGVHIILILVVAGIFFTLGLYMILTYPKSSLIEILTYMTEVKQKRRTSEY